MIKKRFKGAIREPKTFCKHLFFENIRVKYTLESFATV